MAPHIIEKNIAANYNLRILVSHFNIYLFHETFNRTSRFNFTEFHCQCTVIKIVYEVYKYVL